ncbi:MAG TPA: hypothetical protein VLT82_09350 [Myxococcaceae bacterium]|nr:hypothetical protein [Myxococcaceae bacterium]
MSALFFRLLLGMSAAAGPAAEAPATTLTSGLREALSGTWVYAGGDAEQAKVDAAVDRAVANLPPLSRKIASDSLRPRARPRAQYVLAFEGTAVRITSPDDPEERGEVGGPPVSLTNRFGDHSQTTFRVQGGTLVEAGWNPDGSGETVFTPGEDGKTLLVHRVMRSSKLAAPVDMTLTYRRQD